MNAYVSKEELALLPANRISYPEHYADARRGRSGVIGGLLGRVSAFLSRQRVLGELNTLSDRELMDIGLNRAELRNVFDPAFTTRR